MEPRVADTRAQQVEAVSPGQIASTVQEIRTLAYLDHDRLTIVIQNVDNLLDWQKRQNGTLQNIQTALDKLMWWLIGILVLVAVMFVQHILL